MLHQRQPLNPSLRELLNQLVNTFKYSFDTPKHCQSEVTATEIANARLSEFEKRYVSFPEFIDINANETSTRRQLYSNNNQSQRWNQRGDTLTSC